MKRKRQKGLEAISELPLLSGTHWRVQIPNSIWNTLFFASSASSSIALIVSQRFGLRLPETEGPSPPSSSSPSSLRPWTFTTDQITVFRRRKVRRGSWRRISKMTDRSPPLPPATRETPSSPTSRNRSSFLIQPSHGRNPIVLPPSAPRTLSRISPKTVHLFVILLHLFLFYSFAEFGSLLVPSVVALHSVLVFVCRGSGERDC